jgi:hypothetical protein
MAARHVAVLAVPAAVAGVVPAASAEPPAPAPAPAASAPAADEAQKAACVQAFSAAQDLRGARKLLAAREALIRCGQQGCPDFVRAQCVDWGKELEAELPSIVVVAKDVAGRDTLDVALTVDGALVAGKLEGAAVPLDPGAHEVLCEHAGQIKKQTVVVSVGQKFHRVSCDFGPATPPAAPAAPAAAPRPGPWAYFQLPESLPYREGDEIPPGYEKERRVRRGLVIGGAVTAGALYLTTAAVGIGLQTSAANDGGRVPMFVPGFGPFIAPVTLKANTAGSIFLILDGVGQSAGIFMFVAGFAWQEDVLVLRRPPVAGVELELVPVGPNGPGLGLRGRF